MITFQYSVNIAYPIPSTPTELLRCSPSFFLLEPVYSVSGSEQPETAGRIPSLRLVGGRGGGGHFWFSSGTGSDANRSHRWWRRSFYAAAAAARGTGAPAAQHTLRGISAAHSPRPVWASFQPTALQNRVNRSGSIYFNKLFVVTYPYLHVL